MNDDFVAGLPASDTVTDLPDNARSIGTADVVAEFGVIAVTEDRDRLAEGCPDVVEIDSCRHHTDNDLEGPGFRGLDFLELEGVLRLALGFLPDHPGSHLLRQLTGLDVKFAHISEIYWHFAPLGFFKVGGILHS